jgi:filamentous hemagglutinin family protein
MNHIYRLLWNEAVNAWVAVSEITKARGRRSRSAHRLARTLGLTVLTLSLSLARGPAYANPEGGLVAAGSATITSSPGLLTVNQTTDKAIINWRGFSIGADEHTRFVQPAPSSVTLNRVTGADPSEILGRLTANGNLFLVNPNGVVFGTNTRIDVNSLMATTHDIRNEDFLAGHYRFTIQGKPEAMIVNQGTITAAEAGLVALVAPAVRNDGVIAAHLGKVALAAGTGFTLDLYGDRLVELEVEPLTLKALTLDGKSVAAVIENAGRIEAGTVFLTANTAREVVDNVINMSGIVIARNARQEGGAIILEGSDGNVTVSGTLDASAAPAAVGPADGGEILVFGDSLTLESTARLLANAAETGGDGGFIETSGRTVTIRDLAHVSTTAPNGRIGTWLIDPNDFTIAASGGNMTGAAVSAALAENDFEIQTTTMGTAEGNGDIFVNDAVAWSANNLTLTAERNIEINAVMDATGTAGLLINTGGSGAVNVAFNPDGNFAGKVNLAGTTSLTINGNNYTVINSIAELQDMRNNLAGRYALGSDIDASATATWNEGYGFIPVVAWELGGDIGIPMIPFTGAFDGLGHIITNLYINFPDTEYVGLFGAATGSDIRNAGLVHIDITGKNIVGGLAGSADGHINNSYVSGTVNGSFAVGGLVGGIEGTISNSYADVNVTGGAYLGGLAGLAENTTIRNSYANGSVTGSLTFVGGLVGYSQVSMITNSYATSSVSGGFESYQVGGLTGFNSGNISNSYATGAVIGGWLLGGDGLAVGNLVGYNAAGGTIANSYWRDTGSGIGVNDGTVTDSQALTTTQMKQMESFSGWDISATGGSDAVWRIYEGDTSPLLRIFLTPLTVTAGNDARLYDGGTYSGGNGVSFSPSDYNDNKVLGTLSYGGNSQGAINAGSYAIIPSGFYSSQYGYDISYANGQLTISPATLVITADNQGREYGEANPTFAASYSGFRLDDDDSVVSGLTLSSEATQASNVGSYTVIAAGGTATNYIITHNNGVLTITPAGLTVTADDKSRKYGEANPLLTASYSGFKLTDDASVVSNLDLATPAVQSSDAGLYRITASGGTATNYILSFVDGVLTVMAMAALPEPEPELLANTLPDERLASSDDYLWTVGTSGENAIMRLHVRDTQPPGEGQLSGRDLPDPESMELIDALLALSAEEYTPEERAMFYKLLPGEYVVASLKRTGHDALAEFFSKTETGAHVNEADLRLLLESQDGMIQGLGVPMFGIFDRMRRLAMANLLEVALDELRKNPDAADVLDDGNAGGKTRIAIRPRFETADGLVEIDGRLENISNLPHLKVNGLWTYVDNNGKFAARLPVPAGEQSVTLEVNDPTGSRATKRVEVRSEADGTRNPLFTRKPEGRKIALLIAVEEYDSAIPELVTPVRDARAIGGQLEAGYGFETRLLQNPTKMEVLEAMRGLTRELSEHDSLTVFYAGHGYLVEETGRGYWLPRDAETTSPKNWISNRDVARLFHRTRAKQILMVSDSCYSGSFTRDGAMVEAGGGPARDLRAVMALSSGGEQPVWDGGGEGHSVFAAKMISALENGEAEAGVKLYRTVRTEVVKASPQVPGYGAMISAGYDSGADYALR